MDFTSHDVVAVVKGILGERHLGHTGTLDPNATGVLPICLGYATRLIEYMDSSAKTYEAVCRLGTVTDTQDIWGTVLARYESHVTENRLLEVLQSFVGEIEQIPSKYSAIRVNGRHLYSYAHSGEEVEIPKRMVTVYKLALLHFDEEEQEFSFRIDCSRGTYVRTICHDIGAALGPGACMTALRRTSCCGFSMNEAVTLEELKNTPKDQLQKWVKPVEAAVSFMNRTDISEEQKLDFRNGKHLKQDQKGLASDKPVCVFCDNQLCGIGIWDNPDRIKPIKVFIQ